MVIWLTAWIPWAKCLSALSGSYFMLTADLKYESTKSLLKKIPSEMEVAPRYKLLTLLTLLTMSILFKLFYTAAKTLHVCLYILYCIVYIG